MAEKQIGADRDGAGSLEPCPVLRGTGLTGMRFSLQVRLTLAVVCSALVLAAQGVAPARPFTPPEPQPPQAAKPVPQPAGQPPAGQPPAGQPPAAPGAPQTAPPAPQTAPPAAPRLTDSGAFMLPAASLTQLIELL